VKKQRSGTNIIPKNPASFKTIDLINVYSWHFLLILKPAGSCHFFLRPVLPASAYENTAAPYKGKGPAQRPVLIIHLF